MKCVNVHVCQSCFLTDRQTRKHKTHHPVLEFCKQVSTHVTGSTGNRTGIRKLREQNRYQEAQGTEQVSGGTGKNSFNSTGKRNR